jgi:uncharacterized membrane protein
MSAENFFSTAQKEQIKTAIYLAELNTSGEIRVHIEKKCNGDVIKVAEKVFAKLKMHETKLRNGILFYLAIESRVFSIYGDQGINEKVPSDFWNEIASSMEGNFRKSAFTEGLVEGITLSGIQLKQHFPYSEDDANELLNEISFK